MAAVSTGIDNHSVGEAEQSYRLASQVVRTVKGTASVAFEGSCKLFIFPGKTLTGFDGHALSTQQSWLTTADP